MSRALRLFCLAAFAITLCNNVDAHGSAAGIGGAERVEALAVTTDVLSNTYVVGKTSVSLAGNQHFGGTDIFLVRFNEVGQPQ